MGARDQGSGARECRKGVRGQGSGVRAPNGWALLVILFFSALLVISLTRVLPRAAFETRRDREADLIFRGRQYSRAIQLYFRKFRKYPASLDELENTNQIRFLRKRFRDPIANSEEWRLLHIGPAGVLVDSVLQKAPGLPGAPGTEAGAAGGGLSTTPGTGFGTGGQQGSPLPGPPPGPGVPTSGFIPQLGQQAPGATQPAQPAVPGQLVPGTQSPQQPGTQFPQQSSGLATPGFPVTGAEGGSVGATVGGFAPPGGTSTAPVQQFGTGIAGVASKTETRSIKIYNGRQKYNEWEFVYDFRRDPLMMGQAGAGVPGQPGQPGQPQVPQPGQPGFPGGFGTQPPGGFGPGGQGQPQRPPQSPFPPPPRP